VGSWRRIEDIDFQLLSDEEVNADVDLLMDIDGTRYRWISSLVGDGVAEVEGRYARIPEVGERDEWRTGPTVLRALNLEKSGADIMRLGVPLRYRFTQEGRRSTAIYKGLAAEYRRHGKVLISLFDPERQPERLRPGEVRAPSDEVFQIAYYAAGYMLDGLTYYDAADRVGQDLGIPSKAVEQAIIDVRLYLSSGDVERPEARDHAHAQCDIEAVLMNHQSAQSGHPSHDN
jgi:hypothetical protein